MQIGTFPAAVPASAPAPASVPDAERCRWMETSRRTGKTASASRRPTLERSVKITSEIKFIYQKLLKESCGRAAGIPLFVILGPAQWARSRRRSSSKIAARRRRLARSRRVRRRNSLGARKHNCRRICINLERNRPACELAKSEGCPEPARHCCALLSATRLCLPDRLD